MTDQQAITTLLFQLSKPNTIVGTGLKEAIKRATEALAEKIAREKGDGP